MNFGLTAFATAVLACVVLVPEAVAITPAGANNKSVEMAWREYRVDKVLRTGAEQRHTIMNKLVIFVSSQGRVFSELVRNSNISRQAGSDKPMGVNRTWKINWRFEGRTLVGLQGFGPTGARRLSVDFDESFHSCRARVQTGRSGNGNIVATYLETGLQAEVLSETIDTPTCSVSESNPFSR